MQYMFAYTLIIPKTIYACNKKIRSCSDVPQKIYSIGIAKRRCATKTLHTMINIAISIIWK